MEILKVSTIEKPEFVSEVAIKVRPEMKVICIHGRGDPSQTFDDKLAKVYGWLKSKGINPVKNPPLGIYYKKRDEVGVKNVEWDACVPVDENVETKHDFKLQVLPESTVVSTLLTGEYKLIGPALEYMEAVSLLNRVKTKLPLTEIYIKEGEMPITELQYFVAEK